MEHIAILKKSLKLTEKILDGRKTIESRWYCAKYPPWNRINAGETIYFKDSGEPVTIKAEIEKVLQFELSLEKVKEILAKFGSEGKICIRDSNETFEQNKDKKYCILVFIKNPEAIAPFTINKKGFGLMSAWICTNDVEKIKIKPS
ncbi:MAG: ASCH domain-containing protein [Nanoarchaeota archaeon]